MADYSRYKIETLMKMWDIGNTAQIPKSGNSIQHIDVLYIYATAYRERHAKDLLCEVLPIAFSEYYKAAVKPCGDGSKFLKSPEARKLAQLSKRCEAIREEIVKRSPIVENKCVSCIHNIGATVMDCEYACAGVEEIADEGRVTIRCSDYEQREE